MRLDMEAIERLTADINVLVGRIATEELTDELMAEMDAKLAELEKAVGR